MIKCFWHLERWFARIKDISLSSNQKTKGSSTKPHATPLECATNRKVIFVVVSFMREKDCDKTKTRNIDGSNALVSMCYPPRHFQALEFWGSLHVSPWKSCSTWVDLPDEEVPVLLLTSGLTATSMWLPMRDKGRAIVHVQVCSEKSNKSMVHKNRTYVGSVWKWP